MTQSQYYPGFDLLKLILAILIIAAHTQLFEEFPIIHQIIGPIEGSAIPTFFAISAYLFYQRISNCTSNNESYAILKKNIKRLLTIFCIWYILMLPMTYFRFFSVATIKETIYAILLTCTFNGYWFFKALIINTIILYLCRNKKSLIVSSILFFLIYIYWAYNYIFSYCSIPISPYYSFYYHTFYFYIGALIARYQSSIHCPKISILLILYIGTTILSYNLLLYPICRIIIPILLILLFKQLANTLSKQVLLKMRALSILLYVSQFIIIWLYNGFSNKYFESGSEIYLFLQYSITRFTIVFIIGLGISLLIIKLEQKRSLSFLKMLH